VNAFLHWIARLAGIAGVVLGIVAIVVRFGGAFWLRGFQLGTLLLAGMADMMFACLGYLALLVEQHRGGASYLHGGVRMRGESVSEPIPRPFMHRLVSATVLAFSSFALPAPAVAQGWTFDGSELARFAADYERLRDSGEATNDPSLAARVAYFNGFVLGVARANADRGWYCLPTEAVAGQTWDAVATFLREHPEFLDRRASTLVNGALAKGFPCAERPAPTKKPTVKPKPKPSAGAKPSR
jgi:hypothetical protein